MTERKACPAFHAESETRCEGDDDGHTLHYFTYSVEWESCPLCGGEMHPTYDANREYVGDKIKHWDHCPKLPMTADRAMGLIACQCPKRPCLSCDAAYGLPEGAGEQLEDAAATFLREGGLALDDLTRVTAFAASVWDGRGDRDLVYAAVDFVATYPDREAVAEAEGWRVAIASADPDILAKWAEEGLSVGLQAVIDPWVKPF